MQKFIAASTLIGISLGILITLFFPYLALFVGEYRILLNNTVGIPSYSPKTGSFLNSLPLISIFTGLLGALVGFILYKIKHINR